MLRKTNEQFNIDNIYSSNYIDYDKKQLKEEKLMYYKFDCGYEFNAMTGSNRSFMSRFKLHCKVCKTCNENMKSGKYNEMIQYRQLLNKVNNLDTFM